MALIGYIYSTMVTLKQLANELGLSVSTVSKALHDSYEINENTKERVRKLAEKYNYRPNKVAKNLRNQQSKTIGVVIPNILNYFFAKVLLGIEEEASKRGYQIIICLSNNKYQKEVDCLELLSDGSVDGFILSMAKETQKLQKTDHFRKVINQGFPITMFDRVSDKIANCNKVVNDDKNATYRSVKYLYKSSCKHIALITSLNDVSIGRLRIDGYKQAVSDFFGSESTPIIVEINNKREYEAKINWLFKQHNNIDGIIATDNVSAATALKIAHRNGYNVPKDVSIIGFSDNKISRLLNPSLTTVNQNALEIGKEAVQTLIESLTPNTTDFVTKIVDTELLVRESTKNV